jgi:hypothetical protein
MQSAVPLNLALIKAHFSYTDIYATSITVVESVSPYKNTRFKAALKSPFGYPLYTALTPPAAL